MTDLAESISSSEQEQQPLGVLQAIERSRDIQLVVKNFEEVFDPQFNVPSDIKQEVCNLRIRTLQKMWLPPEYTQAQAAVYAEAVGLFEQARGTRQAEARINLVMQANACISAYEERLLGDPIAHEVRDTVQQALYEAMDEIYKDEFARTIGMEVTKDTIMEPSSVSEEKVRPATVSFGRRVVGNLVSLKTAIGQS